MSGTGITFDQNVQDMIDVNQELEDLIGLPNVDESELSGYDDDTHILLHIHDPDEENLPSIKHGTLMFTLLFLGLVMLSAVLVATIIYCSRRQERRKQTQVEAKEKVKSISLRDSLTCRPWSDNYWGDVTAELSDDGETTRFDELSDVSASEAVVDPEAPLSARLSSLAVDPDEHRHRDASCCGPVTTNGKPTTADENRVCRLCKSHFEFGEPVYESNNPQCRHLFHKVCMDRWLGYQNSCPTCNNAYVLQTV